VYRFAVISGLGASQPQAPGRFATPARATSACISIQPHYTLCCYQVQGCSRQRFAPVLTNKDANSCIRVSENSSSKLSEKSG
jgi:hypothetical protein